MARTLIAKLAKPAFATVLSHPFRFERANELERKYQKAFARIKGHLNRGVPVIIHQFWQSTASTGHYRVVTVMTTPKSSFI